MFNEKLLLKPSLGHGIYTIPDAAHILKMELPTLRRWINGYRKVNLVDNNVVHHPIINNINTWGEAYSRSFNFYTLIELYTIMTLRELGVSFKNIRQARNELSERFKTQFPFASNKLMCDGKRILTEFKNKEDEILLQLGTDGQTAFKKIIEPFCHKLEFSLSNEMVERY
ncbi:hypothetical protein HY745_04690 [Candidatus Desantisbacteria bacterium]|nr:hypothetical protein [Candidatus Desantisbacteria bacterium]